MRRLYLPLCLLCVGPLAGCTSEQAYTPPTPAPESQGPGAGENAATPEGTAATAADATQGEDDPDVTAEEVRRELGEAAEAVEEYSEDTSQEVVENAQKTLDQLKQDMERLKQDVGELHETAQGKLEESIGDLDRKLADAQQRLDQLRDAGADAWAESKDDLQKALDNLQRGYTEAVTAFEEANANDAETKPAGTSSQPE